ncbi:hypothetical protein [Martelella alba]|uniref:Uncharacterized protein n=1 Tax=Martelella alba TaxID=2590451 RepID=A0ABY2SRD4_9HYPH|nr:hypothetical protein [Martelella alba]TKI08653.1 hypothetical protein FCN80_00960 [Martelella alba]
MADQLIKISQENWVMASAITRVESGSYGDVYIWANGVKLWLEPGYGESSWQAKDRIINAINAALKD